MKFSLYSVPGAVGKNCLESRLRSVLSRHPRLSPRGSAFLLTLALGVTLPVLAVRLHLVRDADELVKQAGEIVILPGGVCVLMRGFQTLQVLDKKLQRIFWSSEGQPIPVPHSLAESFGGLIGLMSVIEVQVPAGSDAHVSGSTMVSNPSDDDLQKARQYVAYSAKTVSVRVGQGAWTVAAKFDSKGTLLSGHSVHLQWEGASFTRAIGITKSTWASEDTLPDTDSRLVALDSTGQEYVIRSTASSHADGKVAHQVCYRPTKLWPIAKDKIVAYRYETRPWTQIRFEGWKAPKGITP
ncbi:hypothetical protein [Armatimonas sp.]|uniref:hypothetical protein n=1 Tax=Armatimonas sp. TaxID=1872638 RepID=UPI00286C5A98|nr:hypothetical protein [Armatimonas sp.]